MLVYYQSTPVKCRTVRVCLSCCLLG